MNKATENQGKLRALGENFSPRTKVMGLPLQHNSLPHFTSFSQETPMKPSQVPNWLSYHHPRRALPLQTPEHCNKDRFVSHSPCPVGPIHSSVLVPVYPTYIDSPLNHSTKNRLGSLNHFAQPCGLTPNSPANTGTQSYRPYPPMWQELSVPQQTLPSEPRHFSSPQLVPAQQINNDTSAARPLPPNVFHPTSPQFVQSLNHHSPSCNVKRDQETESKMNSSSSGSNNETSQRKESNKIQQQLASSSENPVSAGDLKFTSQKRNREFDNCYENAKKLCPDGANSGKTNTVMPIPGSSTSTSTTSQVSQPSLKKSSVFELAPKTTDDHLHKELACGQSSQLPSTSKPTHTHCTSSSKDCTKKGPSVAVKQYTYSSQSNVVSLKSHTKPSEESGKRKSEENQRKDKSSKAEVPQKVSSTSVLADPVRPSSGHAPCSAHVLPAKIFNRGDQMRENRKTDCNTPKTTSKPNSGAPSCRTHERSKINRGRRLVIPDDIDQLFTPDPKTYVVSPPCKTVKPKIDGETIKLPISEKASSPASGSSPSVTGSSCHKTPLSRVTELPHTTPSSKCKSPVEIPTVTLERVKLRKLNLSSKDKAVISSPNSSESHLKDADMKSDNSCTPLDSRNGSSSSLKSDTTASEQTSSPQCTPSQSLEKQPSEQCKNVVNEEDLIDMDLDLGLSFKYSLDVTQSSDSSEEEQLISLQEMMECIAKPPQTPEKGAFSVPSTPGHKSSQPKTILSSTIKSGVYKNNLDQMLEEINNNKRAKEVEAQLLTACKEDLLRIAEYEEEEENQEEDISTEQQEFLLRYSLISSAIREVPPGEVVFNLERFGCIFDQHTLQLRQCMVSPQGTAQKALLWSSPAQLRLHVIIGLFQDAYDYNSPCPPQVTRFLFKMMSVHRERMVSEKILQALNDIACSAAYQIGKNGSHQFEVWVPSLADVTLVLMNMGVSFVTLFPFENRQPLFTEGDLLEDVYVKNESPFSKEQMSFPEHNCSNILKYLSYCMGLCPRAYSDDELLLLLTMIGKISLDTQRILQSTVEVSCLQYKIVNNIRDWDSMLPKICLALTDLTDDHHNMCLLVQLLPDNTRGKQLRRHLSLSMISKLLSGSSTYRPTQEEFQLAELRPYLPRMQPSALLRGLCQKDKEEDIVILDQQAYYLCHSLLTLTNEASNFQFFPAHQKAQLLLLSSELETHVKCDIRENEKCLYRSKVKDLVARIYTKWQMLLQRTRPLNGKLYDYWQPVDTFGRNQEDGEDTGIEEADEEEEQITLIDENDEMFAEEEEEEEEEEEKQGEKMEEEEDMELDQWLEENYRDSTEDDASKSKEATLGMAGDFKQVIAEMQLQLVDEKSNGSLREQSSTEN